MSEDITTAEETAATPPIDETSEQILKIVETSQSQGVFNLSEVVKGRGYPTKEATIYLDADSAFQLAELNDLMNEYVDEDVLAQNELKAAELAEKVKKSAVTFVMRGVSQKIVEDVVKKTNEKTILQLLWHRTLSRPSMLKVKLMSTYSPLKKC
jgi:hypothetical protein